MPTLQINIEEKDIIKKLHNAAKKKGLSKTAFARMVILERIEEESSMIDKGLQDVLDGKISPSFNNSEDAVNWLDKQ